MSKALCLDMEGVLTPEIWLHVRDRSGIQELNLTTREVKDYRELMDRRVEICARHGLALADIQRYIAELEILPGARDFVDWARERYQVFILSDTFYAFADNFMRQLGRPALFCHDIFQDAGRLRYTLRQENPKQKAVEALRGLNFRVGAVGDSYNDIHMLRAAHTATFFRAPDGIRAEFPEYGNLTEYKDLKIFLSENL
ncbi:MAG: thrH [Fibrobacteria bacterium]|nr:thrH [Fibrobacteria bacterium]